MDNHYRFTIPLKTAEVWDEDTRTFIPSDASETIHILVDGANPSHALTKIHRVLQKLVDAER